MTQEEAHQQLTAEHAGLVRGKRGVLKRVLGWQQRLCVRKDFKVGLLRQLWHLLAVLS